MPDTQVPAGDSASTVPAVLDREKLCPFLLKMYYNQAQHHRVDDFSPTSTPPASSELRLYTWKNATFGEITSLVKQALPDLLAQAGSNAQLAFRHIYLDINRGLYIGRDAGVVRIESHLNIPSSSSATSVEGISTKDFQNNNEAAAGGRSASRPSALLGSRAYEKSLNDIKFVIGDYLDIAITSPMPGFVPPSTRREGGGGPMRHRGGPASGGGGRSRHGGGGGNGGHGSFGAERLNPMGDRLTGRLGGGGSGGGGRNGHGQGFGGRLGQAALDVQNEPSWKGRGRGR